MVGEFMCYENRIKLTNVCRLVASGMFKFGRFDFRDEFLNLRNVFEGAFFKMCGLAEPGRNVNRRATKPGVQEEVEVMFTGVAPCGSIWYRYQPCIVPIEIRQYWPALSVLCARELFLQLRSSLICNQGHDEILQSRN